MSYRIAGCLDVLRNEVDQEYPDRSKTSDGWIGDAAHATRTSDHNPWLLDAHGTGVVRALDITHDPSSGCDADRIAERLRKLGRKGDRRLQDGGYVIWNRRIASARSGWLWRPYNGSNPHTQHVHVSVSTVRSAFDSRQPWGVGDRDRRGRPPRLKRGSKRRWWVRKAQRKLGLTPDGVYGDQTVRAVKAFRRRHRIWPVNGRVGRRVWRAMGVE